MRKEDDIKRERVINRSKDTETGRKRDREMEKRER
jgi:hypothetical protein